MLIEPTPPAVRVLAERFYRLLDLTLCGSDSLGDLLGQEHMPIVVGVARVREAVQLVAEIKLVERRLEMVAH
ncbi:MAG TPA: hypothetical protein VNU19_05870 [Candidatus Acidoferrum sp.]|nr:hypothetical protein [Candidatus Acidoferrum sp.]